MGTDFGITWGDNERLVFANETQATYELEVEFATVGGNCQYRLARGGEPGDLVEVGDGSLVLARVAPGDRLYAQGNNADGQPSSAISWLIRTMSPANA